MKTQFTLLLAVVKTVLSLPAQQVLLDGNDVQIPDRLEGKLLPLSWPGIDLDLDERRLVQLEGAESPIWMTELDKVSLILCPLRCITCSQLSSRFWPKLLAGSSSTCRCLFRHVFLCAQCDPRTEDPTSLVESFRPLQTSKAFPKPNATAAVSDVISILSTDGPQRDLATFTSFRTRCELLMAALHYFVFTFVQTTVVM